MFHPRRVSTRSEMSVSAALAFLLLLVALPEGGGPVLDGFDLDLWHETKAGSQ